MSKAKNLLRSFVRWWRNQPEITYFRPFKLPDEPQPIPFDWNINGRTIKGFVLRTDPKPRVLSKRGNSHELTFSKDVVKYVKPYAKSRLGYQQHDKLYFKGHLLEFPDTLALLAVLKSHENENLVEEVII